MDRLPRVSAALVVAAVIASAGLAARQTGAQTPPATSQTSEVTIVGCLGQGSDATVFILNHARRNPDDANEKRRIYRVVAVGDDLDLSRHVNREVSVTGTADGKSMSAPGVGQKIHERGLPKFSARTVVPVGEKCIPPGR